MRNWDELATSYDGPIPPAETAAARWGVEAHARLERAADAALIESRVRSALAAIASLRRTETTAFVRGVDSQLRRLNEFILGLRQRAVS